MDMFHSEQHFSPLNGDVLLKADEMSIYIRRDATHTRLGQEDD
jgi:hypothetical protein